MCSACGRSKIEFSKSLLLGFGFSVKCPECGSRVRLNALAQTFFYIFIGFLTVFLLVVLTNNFGMVGFAMAFIVPLVIDLIFVHFLPLEVIEKRDDIS
jgi:hypothetical protein